MEYPKNAETIDFIRSKLHYDKLSPKASFPSERKDEFAEKDPLINQLGEHPLPQNNYAKKQMHKRLHEPHFIPQNEIRKWNPTFLPENLNLYRHGH